MYNQTRRADGVVEINNLVETWNTIIGDVKSGKIKVQQGYECPDCYNSGLREIADPQGGNYRGVVRCNRCNYWNFRENR